MVPLHQVTGNSGIMPLRPDTHHVTPYTLTQMPAGQHTPTASHNNDKGRPHIGGEVAAAVPRGLLQRPEREKETFSESMQPLAEDKKRVLPV